MAGRRTAQVGLHDDGDVTYAPLMRVLTLNLWARSGPYAVRQPLLRQGIALLAPDLLALQEVDFGPGTGNQAEDLLAPLGYDIAYERRIGENVADPGIAVASRHPIVGRQLIELPHGGAGVAARIQTSDGPFWFCSAVPMPGWPGFEGQREDEAVALDAAVADLAEGDELPPILAGDFDATPESASIRFLTGQQSLKGRSTVWYDAWAVAGDGSPGYTWSSDNPYVAPFAAAVFAQPVHHRRIDYLFIGSPFRWRPRVVVRSCQVVLTGGSQAAPSDHYGVMADLDLNGVALAGGRGLDAWAETEAMLWPR
jgi:endonuclease/exonuclease/phosphatase family metal-dependent hydrolase